MNRQLLLIPLLPAVIALVGCSESEMKSLSRQFNTWGDSSAQADEGENFQPYGATGTITNSEAAVVRGLIAPGQQPDQYGVYYFAQPQSRGAITSRLGFGQYEASNYGRYQTGSGSVDIFYDASGRAIGFRENSIK